MTESRQQRGMRVRITCDVETGGAIEKRELPFVAGILADLTGDATEKAALEERRFIEIDRDRFDDVLKSIAPGVRLDPALPGLARLRAGAAPGHTLIRFTSLADFDPPNLVRSLPALRSACLARTQIRWLQSKAEIDGKVAARLERWLESGVTKESAATWKARAQLAAVLDGAPLPPAGTRDLRTHLAVLFDVLQQLQAAQDALAAASDPAAARTALEAAHVAALAALAQWNLFPDENTSEDTIVAWGAMLAGALALPDTPHDQPLAMPLNDVDNCVVADGCAAFLRVAHFLRHSAGDARLLAHELLGLIELLGPDNAASVPSIVYRLQFFINEIVQRRDAQDIGLSKARPRGVCAAIEERVARIDSELSAALSSIMHSAPFRSLEASWRGLHFLVANSATGSMLKLKVLNATKTELRQDLEDAAEFDQSKLFKHIHEAGYGTLGGFPYSLLIGDYEIGGGAGDIGFIKKMAEAAAAAHAPFIAAAHPGLFGLNDYRQLATARDLSRVFERQELAPWREFRAMEEARYVTLVLPRVLLRLPYGKAGMRNTLPREGLDVGERAGAAPPRAAGDGSIGAHPAPVTDNFLWGFNCLYRT